MVLGSRRRASSLIDPLPSWRIAVAERSMEPALRPGDWLLARRSVRPGGSLPVTPGRLVIARHPQRPGLLLVKRAVRAGRLLADRGPGPWPIPAGSPGPPGAWRPRGDRQPGQ